ncbi:hypothetical protein A4157S3_1060004 [Escherichia coli]|nr:hypothetical protein [Escherichia coli]MJE15937.1 hypothetical protein [Escherichia coli]PNY59271.1 hypothetical protein C2M27_02460 [Escherichia coli]TFL38262.1 hypothetical protein ELY49_25665 [Escherichia coli]TFL53106.1 hypothetical protein ELY35_23930 [Escherichia coli]
MSSLARFINFLPTDEVTIPLAGEPLAAFGPKVKRQSVMALCTRQVSAGEIVMRIGASRAVLYNER